MPGRDVVVPRPAIHVPRSWSGCPACDVIDQISFEYVCIVVYGVAGDLRVAIPFLLKEWAI